MQIDQQFNPFEYSRLNQQQQQQIYQNKQQQAKNSEDQNPFFSISKDGQSTSNNMQFNATFNFNQNLQLQQNGRKLSREGGTKLPSISSNQNQQLNLLQQQSQQQSTTNSAYQSSIKQFQNANPKSMVKYAQISLANNDPTVRYINEQGFNSSLKNRKIQRTQIQSVTNGVAAGTISKAAAYQNQVVNQNSQTNHELYPLQNNSNSTQETTPEMSIKSTNYNSPVGQKVIGLNMNQMQMLSPSMQQQHEENMNNNQYFSIVQSVPVSQMSQQQNQQSNMINSVSSRVGMRTNSPKTLNPIQLAQAAEVYYSKNLAAMQSNIQQSQREAQRISPQYNSEIKVNQKSDTSQVNYQNKAQNKYDFNEDQKPELKEINNFASAPHSHQQSLDVNERQKTDTIVNSTLQKQKMFLPPPDQQIPKQQINLKTYFEQQNMFNQNLNNPSQNLTNQNLQPYESLMRKHQSLGQMTISKRIQLDPIKISDPINQQTLTTNGTASTKKFLTRKPQTKILNRVFSSKADVKPNKNVINKNIPQTANSQQTTNSPLFNEDHLNYLPEYNLNTEPPQFQANGPTTNEFKKITANFFSQPEKDILNEEIERKQQEKILYESNIYSNLDSKRNYNKQIGELDSLQSTLSRGAKVIQNHQRLLQKPAMEIINNRQQIPFQQGEQYNQQQQFLNFKNSRQNFKPQVQQISFQ
ncbi:hypothetical protein TTHERM_00540450 (macronuclear) [Tetrahymena thermophila SB210]|uniref:Uncharacterized protein n=1 Tax=Tetrahymena thermophila (strain SB210) TaxID=312017 RepID=I7M0J7_TETTS|nr:hypothetical protein TTHERM_00540450 [Tetrahymena thermophila SB210]EAR87725.2 hypothetical protein TTHERM_00540450 [Tetrahymena thermophila SB210]|eukprot:XP_001007970.2 hypothetical protein TTHERM_00540450 [Tetrahymena thermophila SB210]